METPDNKYDNYSWGLFYYNRLDKKIFAPKTPRRGLFFNFANIWSYVLLAFMIAALACIYKVLLNYMPLLTDDKTHYTAGFIYYNEADERLFIPRADGSGWTLNFANNWSYLILGLVVIIVVNSMARRFGRRKN